MKDFQKQNRYTFKDIVIGSNELKKLLISRCDELGVSLFHVSQEAGVNWRTLRDNYLNKTNALSRPTLRQSTMIKLFDIVGIKIRVQAVICEPDPVMIQKLKDKPFRQIKNNGQSKKT